MEYEALSGFHPIGIKNTPLYLSFFRCAEKRRLYHLFRFTQAVLKQRMRGFPAPGAVMMHICFATDDNYASAMGVAICSILKNAGPTDEFHFYVLENSVSAENKRKIALLRAIRPFELDYIHIHEADFKSLPIVNKHLSLSTYYRFSIARLLPQVDKILYLDCDILVLQSLRPLYETDMTGVLLAGAEDLVFWKWRNTGTPEERLSNHKYYYVDEEFEKIFETVGYFNAGVLVLNLALMREMNLERMCFECAAARRDRLKYEDQDVLNFVCGPLRKQVSQKWNLPPYSSLCRYLAGRKEDISPFYQDAAVIHFIQVLEKPWRRGWKCSETDLYRQYMRLGPWPDIAQEPRGWRFKKLLKYWLAHPLCFLKPAFYRNGRESEWTGMFK